MCYRPPVHVVCPNDEVVVFQTQTVNAPDLRSIANITTIISLPPHLLQQCYGSSLPPPGTHYYHPTICHHYTTLHFYLLHLFLPTTLPGGGASAHLDISPTPRRPTLVPALTSLAIPDLLPRSLLAPGVPRRMPVVAVYLVRSPNPFLPSACAQAPVSP